MDSTKGLVDNLFATKMFHCAHCKDVLQIPVMSVENIGNVCHTCYDSIKEQDNVVASENAFVNTVLEKMEIPCENESKGCSERIPYKEIQEHKRQCLYQSFRCMAPEECSWTGCLKDFEIHHRETHERYHLQNDLLGTCLEELRAGIYLLQTSCGDFFLSVNKTDQDVAFFICDIGKSIDDVEYNFSVTFSSENARRFSLDCKITDWKSFIAANHAERYNKIKIITNVKCSDETNINLEYLKYIFQADIVSIEILLNVKNEYIPNEECFLENFRCQKCRLYLKSEIFSCSCGYILCDTCKGSVSHQSHIANHCLALESVVKQIRIPCTFKDRGCLVKMPPNNLKHEFVCAYVNLKCTVFGCDFEGTPSLMIYHLQHVHNFTFHRTLTTSKTHSFIFYLIMDNLLFEVRHENAFPDYITWTVGIIGNTKQNYHYQIAISFGQIDITFKAPCKLGRLTITETEVNSTVKLTGDMLQEVGYDGSNLRFLAQILKC